MRRIPAPLGVLVLALGLAACGGASSSGDAGGSPTTAPAPPPPAPTADLKITLHPGLVKDPHDTVYTLTCGSTPGGTLPNPAAACAALGAKPSLLAPLADCQVNITDIGSEEIAGTFAGKAVAMKFKACTDHLGRWTAISKATGAVPG